MSHHFTVLQSTKAVRSDLPYFLDQRHGYNKLRPCWYHDVPVQNLPRALPLMPHPLKVSTFFELTMCVYHQKPYKALHCASWERAWSNLIYTYSLTSFYNYHTSNSCECMGVNGEALQLHTVYKKPYFLLQVT